MVLFTPLSWNSGRSVVVEGLITEQEFHRLMMMINPDHPHDQIRYAIVGFGGTLDANGTIADAEQEVLRDVRQVQSGYYDFILVLVPNCSIVDQIVREHPDRRLIFSVAPFH